MDARNWELIDLVEPGVDGRPPVDASPRPCRERLVEVLANLGKDGYKSEDEKDSCSTLNLATLLQSGQSWANLHWSARR